VVETVVEAVVEQRRDGPNVLPAADLRHCPCRIGTD